MVGGSKKFGIKLRFPSAYNELYNNCIFGGRETFKNFSNTTLYNDYIDVNAEVPAKDTIYDATTVVAITVCPVETVSAKFCIVANYALL